jgi:hypothetical protein
MVRTAASTSDDVPDSAVKPSQEWKAHVKRFAKSVARLTVQAYDLEMDT